MVAVAVSVGDGLGVIVLTKGMTVLLVRVVGGILIDPHPVRINASSSEILMNLVMLSSDKQINCKSYRVHSFLTILSFFYTNFYNHS
jgi:hypothetical protein